MAEPARPEGLGALSPALDSFVDIVGLDRDLVAAVAEGARGRRRDVRAGTLTAGWLSSRPPSTWRCSRASLAVIVV